MIVKFVIFILLPISLCFAYWLFFSGIVGLTRMINSKHWQSWIGEITDADILFKSFGGKLESNSKYKLVNKTTYTYKVNGIEYTGNQTYASDSLFQSDYKPVSQLPKKDRILLENNQSYIDLVAQQKINIGKNITIYFNPKNPKKSCIINTVNKAIFLPIGMGLAFGLGLTVLILMLIENIKV